MWEFEFHLGVNNAWWFLLLFIVVNLIYMVSFPKHYRQRIFKLPDLSNGIVFGVLYALTLNGTMLYSLFVSIKFNTVWMWLGLGLFIVGAILFFMALYDYATTDPNHPVVKGVYRLSRNPQQLLAVLMWIGVALITTSPVMLILCIMQLFLMYPSLIAQEQFCVEKYKEEYIEYMKEVPRYFLCI